MGVVNPTAAPATPDQLWAPANSYETYGRRSSGNLGNQNILLSGRLSLVGGAVIPAGKTPSSITFNSGATAANLPTNQWFSLYDQLLNLLGVTADDGAAAWAINVPKTLLLPKLWTPAKDTPVYLGIVVVGTGMPTLAGSGGTAAELFTAPPILAGVSTAGLVGPGTAPNPAGAINPPGASLPYAYVTC